MVISQMLKQVGEKQQFNIPITHKAKMLIDIFVAGISGLNYGISAAGVFGKRFGELERSRVLCFRKGHI